MLRESLARGMVINLVYLSINLISTKSVKKFWGYVTAFSAGLSNALFLIVIIAVVAMIGFGDGSAQLSDSALLVAN